MIEGNSEEVSISLQDLQTMDQYASKDIHPNQFAAYTCNDQNRRLKKVQLLSLDTNQIPTIPMRRVSCVNCRNSNINCQKCQKCKTKPCCRDLSCIYDYKEWKKDPANQIYYSCKCNKNKGYFSNTFDVDWRLMNIISKMHNKVSPTHNFYLYFGAGMLWIAEQKLDQKNQKTLCGNIYYEDHFGMFYFYEKQIKQQNPINLSESNIRYFTNLLKINVKKYLQAKDNWQVSNLQQECQEIADYFFSHKKLQTIKNNMQSQSDNNYSNMPSLKYQGKFSQSLISSKSKNQNNYEGCSQFTNEQIIFYYCSKTQLMFVRNAKLYQGDTESSNIRGIKIRFIEKGESFEKAIWFKDRKGDLFAINNRSLSIFRYNISQKCYVQFIIESHTSFQKVDSAASLIYVQQKDIVYYFNPRQLKQSFYFSLYRHKGNQDNNKNKKEDPSKYSCTSITIQDIFSDKQKIVKNSGSLCKAIYLMQDYKFKKGKDVRKQLVPVIYLLVEKKNYLPMGIGVFKIIHNQEGVIITEIPSSGPISQGSQSQKNISFNLGVFFALRLQKMHKLFYYTLNDSKPTLLSAKITQNDGKQHLNWTEQYLELNGCNQVKLEFQKKEVDQYLKVVNFMICSSQVSENKKDSKKFTSILINDIAGIPSNNDFRLLGCNSKTGRIVETQLTYAQGNPTWRIYDLG